MWLRIGKGAAPASVQEIILFGIIDFSHSFSREFVVRFPVSELSLRSENWEAKKNKIRTNFRCF